MKKATIADVAELAGVSKATVSRYLNQEHVREEIADKIHAAIDKVGYVAKAVKPENDSGKKAEEKTEKTKAGAKIKKKSYRLGVLVKDISQLHTGKLLGTLQDVFCKQNITYSICVTNGEEALEEVYLTSYIVQNVDGILVDGCSSIEFIQKQMRTTAIPVLFLNTDDTQVHSCSFDETKAGEILGAYMLEKQQLLVRYLATDEALSEKRMQGIQKVYHQKKQPIDLAVALCDGSYVAMYENIKQIFTEKIDMLLLESDDMAVPLSKFIKEYHISVPQNVSIISFGGDEELCKVMSPTLSALTYDYVAYAKEIVAQIVADIEKKSVRKHTVQFTMQERESVR